MPIEGPEISCEKPDIIVLIGVVVVIILLATALYAYSFYLHSELWSDHELEDGGGQRNEADGNLFVPTILTFY